MDWTRATIRNNRTWAALLLAATLLLKLLVPAGYMVSSQNLDLTVTVCTGSMSEHVTRQISIPNKLPSDDEHGRAKSECPFTALTLAAIGGADLALLALAIAFVMALGFAPKPSTDLRDAPQLRPPLRGPPLAA